MFALHTPRARGALCASLLLEVGDVGPDACILPKIGAILAEGAHVHVVLEELHETSRPQHCEGVLDEVHANQSAVLLSKPEHDDFEARADDSVCARQISTVNGLRGRVLRTRGMRPTLL